MASVVTVLVVNLVINRAHSHVERAVLSNDVGHGVEVSCSSSSNATFHTTGIAAGGKEIIAGVDGRTMLTSNVGIISCLCTCTVRMSLFACSM